MRTHYAADDAADDADGVGFPAAAAAAASGDDDDVAGFPVETNDRKNIPFREDRYCC